MSSININYEGKTESHEMEQLPEIAGGGCDSPESITLTFNGYCRQGCGNQSHACSGGGTINIYTSEYNYLTVVSNSRFSGITTGAVEPYTMLTARYSASSQFYSGSNYNSDASLTITLSKV